MRRFGTISLGLLLMLLVGCPKVVPIQAIGDDAPDASGRVPDPSPIPDPGPEVLPPPFTLPLNALSMTVQPLPIPAVGEARFELEAREAILALSRTGDVSDGFAFAFEGATPSSTGLPSLQALPPAPGPACGTFDRTLWPVDAVPSASAYGTQSQLIRPPVLGEAREFYVRTVPVTAVCLALGKYGAFWVDQRDLQDPQGSFTFSAATLDGLLADFDRLVPAITERYGEGPPGRADGYNRGDDRLNFLVSRQVPREYGGFVEPLDFFPDAFTRVHYDKPSNFGKVLYLNAIYGTSHFLNTMVHEFVHLIFYGRRLEVHSLNHGKGLPLGQDTSYFGEADESERWLNEGMAVLSEYLYGRSPEPTYRAYLERYLGAPRDYDLTDFFRLAEQDAPNYGGAFLFSAYANARHPGFVREVQSARGISAAAVDEVMRGAKQPGFSEFYRDYALSLLLDGYHPEVPEAYQIPHVNVYGSYGGARVESATSSILPPRKNGVRYIHVFFTEGSGALRIRDAANLKATVLLLRPSERPGIEDIDEAAE